MILELICLSGLNVSFGSSHAIYEDWLRADLNLITPEHVKGAIYLSSNSGIGGKAGTSNPATV